jgi:hypothetical protein
MDEFGNELTFTLLDELARATVRGCIAPNEFLASRHVGRIGPLVELMLLDRGGTLSQRRSWPKITEISARE